MSPSIVMALNMGVSNRSATAVWVCRTGSSAVSPPKGPEENTAQVEAFLARHPDFSLAESRESVPHESGTDGAFAAKLLRNP